jgi:hypothetical protein
MSLIPNKKNKKDNRPGGGNKNAKPGFQGSSPKAQTKAPNRAPKQTGGAQRGS